MTHSHHLPLCRWYKAYYDWIKKEAIAEYVKGLTTPATSSSHPEGSAAPALPCTQPEDEPESKPKIVCFKSSGYDPLTKYLVMRDPETVFVFNNDNVENMVEAVKHPGVQVALAVDKLRKGSAQTIKKWGTVCGTAKLWGGSIILRMPAACEDWSNGILAKFCLDFGLDYIHREDDVMRFATNCQYTRWALHGGSWINSEGVDEAYHTH